MEIDLKPTSAPQHWSGEWVKARLVEAYGIERRLPDIRRSTGSAWPSINYEFSDVVAQGETASERVMVSWSKGGVFPKELARMEQAQEWLRVILANHEVERFCLAHWATAQAYHRSLRALLGRRRWSRTTFYRRVSKGASIIARRLDHDGVPIS